MKKLYKLTDDFDEIIDLCNNIETVYIKYKDEYDRHFKQYGLDKDEELADYDRMLNKGLMFKIPNTEDAEGENSTVVSKTEFLDKEDMLNAFTEFYFKMSPNDIISKEDMEECIDDLKNSLLALPKGEISH